jgi:hypothetical protein
MHNQFSTARKPNRCHEITAKSLETVGDVANFIEVSVITHGGILNGTATIVGIRPPVRLTSPILMWCRGSPSSLSPRIGAS